MVIVVLAIIFRVNDINEAGRCFIGLKRESSFLLLIYDLVINLYLTIQFLLPILGLYSFQHSETRLRKVAMRTLSMSSFSPKLMFQSEQLQP